MNYRMMTDISRGPGNRRFNRCIGNCAKRLQPNLNQKPMSRSEAETSAMGGGQDENATAEQEDVITDEILGLGPMKNRTWSKS